MIIKALFGELFVKRGNLWTFFYFALTAVSGGHSTPSEASSQVKTGERKGGINTHHEGHVGGEGEKNKTRKKAI